MKSIRELINESEAAYAAYLVAQSPTAKKFVTPAYLDELRMEKNNTRLALEKAIADISANARSKQS